MGTSWVLHKAYLPTYLPTYPTSKNTMIIQKENYPFVLCNVNNVYCNDNIYT
jgi:hypothetical protein